MFVILILFILRMVFHSFSLIVLFHISDLTVILLSGSQARPRGCPLQAVRQKLVVLSVPTIAAARALTIMTSPSLEFFFQHPQVAMKKVSACNFCMLSFSEWWFYAGEVGFSMKLEMWDYLAALSGSLQTQLLAVLSLGVYFSHPLLNWMIHSPSQFLVSMWLRLVNFYCDCTGCRISYSW